MLFANNDLASRFVENVTTSGINELRRLTSAKEPLIGDAGNSLNGRLTDLVSLTLVTEFNGWVSSMGQTESTRNEQIEEFLSQRGAYIMDRYFQGGQSITGRVDTWLAAQQQTLQSLKMCLPELRNFLSCTGTDETLIRGSFDLSDPHQHGRTVSILEVEPGKRAVFKPRDISIEQYLFELGNEINQRAGRKLVSVPEPIVVAPDFGLLEFVPHSPLSEVEELPSYYFNLGVVLAICWVHFSTDMHLENIIACGEFPVIVDAETLMQPDRLLSFDTFSLTNHLDAGMRWLDQCLLRAGILPFSQHQGGRSASGATCPAYADHRQLLHIEPSSEGFRVVPRTEPLTLCYAWPRLTDDYNPANFAGSVRDGFEEGLQILGGIPRIRQLHFQEVFPSSRVVFRTTSYYAQILTGLAHPQVLANSLEEQERWVYSFLKANHNIPPQIKDSELEQLMRGDVPVFYSDAMPGNTPVTWDTVRERAFNPTAGLAEAFLIEDSYLQLAAEINPDRMLKSTVPLPMCTDQGSTASQEKMLEIFTRQVIDRQRIHHGQRFWLNSVKDSDSAYLSVGGQDLYDGRLGTALFLILAGEFQGSSELQEIGLDLLRAQAEFYLNLADGRISVFTGMGGLLMALTAVESFTESPTLFREIQRYESQVFERILQLLWSAESDPISDVIDGIPGISILLANRQLYGKMDDRSDLKSAFSKILPSFQEAAFAADNILPGFAHGLIGIAAGYHSAAWLAGSEEHLECARNLARAGNSAFRLRTFTARESPAVAGKWCYGEPGVLLANTIMIAQGSAPDQLLAFQLKDCEFVGSNLMLSDHSLCHGNAGVFDVMTLLEDAFPRDPTSKRDAFLHAWIAGLEALIDSDGSIGTVGKSSGLLDGLAGVGYTMIRSRVPDRLPSVIGLGLRQDPGIKPQ